ncbi:nucleotidyltransferase domain-containing protein [uncultured Bacteroides sp.]|uniref:nucleotidyltransferase domain-containing protein n=1 Tax=uncultured Bacteroides sp. TaxID=162156 RepID=UPI0026109E6B|nr:nucleotidyltransferase domain-containing protein [uncultured Bacteroides sp.]
MKEPIKNMLVKIKEVVQAIVPEGSHVLLYGSRARGNFHEDSDWDILVILNKPKIEQNDYDEVVYPLTALGWKIGEMIIPVVYTREEWQQSSFTPFYKNVEQDSIVIL